MKQCVICGEKVSFLSHKIYNGHICRKCRAFIPKNIQLKACDTDYLFKLYEKSKEKSKLFDYTASYGSLFIDSTHGMLCVSRGGKGGEPVDYGDIFTVEELENIAIYCTDVRNIGTKSNKIVCNVKLRVKTADINTEYLVYQNESCKFTYGKGSTLDVREPEKLTMFRNMIHQMIENVYYNAVHKLEEIRRLKKVATDAEKEKEWARGVLLLDNVECSLEEIKKHQRVLIRAFHPDTHPELDSEYAQKINKAYEILTK